MKTFLGLNKQKKAVLQDNFLDVTMASMTVKSMLKLDTKKPMNSKSK